MSFERRKSKLNPLPRQPDPRVQRLDLKQTSVRRIGEGFLNKCGSLTAVTFPKCLKHIGGGFLSHCGSLQSVDLHHTSLCTIGTFFAADCERLNSVLLPDTVTSRCDWFLHGCSVVQVTTHSSGAGCEVEECDINYERSQDKTTCTACARGSESPDGLLCKECTAANVDLYSSVTAAGCEDERCDINYQRS